MNSDGNMLGSGMQQAHFNQGMMPVMPDSCNLQGGPGSQMGNFNNGITSEMINNNQRQTYGPITLSNGAIYTGELLNGMKDGYGQQLWQDGSKYDGQW